MSTRRGRKINKKGRGGGGSFKSKFKDTPKRVVMYNRLPTVPDELDWKVTTFGQIRPAGATASISSVIFTNSLLHTADSFNNSGQSATLADVASAYTKYRVVQYKISYVMSPRSTSDVNMTVLHSPTDPAFSAAVSWSPASVTRDKSYYHLVPSETKSPCIVRGRNAFSLSRVVGQKEYEQDVNYAGTVDSVGVFTSPADLTYLTFYQGLVSGSFTANTAVSISVMLEQYVRFYDKRM